MSRSPPLPEIPAPRPTWQAALLLALAAGLPTFLALSTVSWLLAPPARAPDPDLPPQLQPLLPPR
ncbi:hypothetical protein KM176_06005 [Pseudooceanicola sp. CBS1P-1]|uniref:Uncharacterized protein n=1 Tax=Pseudooceanicola albus TaxID=2692189 RepID=A0A6L7G130_9RHOB|nr:MULTISPECIES: hypothetical protein [Pseudooceanicola]MBT9383405.1 hypothetical protein [Pseudooceanicola endophyticus]MXN16273.1 hypothetical protein [Pseudooceanicola albus]